MPTVVDTVVLHYFLVVDRAPLLLDLLDPPVGVPRIVFDPDDESSSDVAVSELRKNIRHEERVARSAGFDEGDDLPRELKEAKAVAETRVARLRSFVDIVSEGRVQVVDLNEDEWELVGRLTAREPDPSLDIMIGIDDGEAACLAIAVERGWVLATDDQDALRVLDGIAPGHPYERIRRLLVRAANDGLISRSEANLIHRDMRRAGFWDRDVPFPDE